jgi:hypothetical protein
MAAGAQAGLGSKRERMLITTPAMTLTGRRSLIAYEA